MTALPKPAEWDNVSVVVAAHSATGGSGAPRGRLFAVAELDQPPVLVGAPVLEYPHHLRKAGIGGQALAAFVVDSAGRVETGSVNIRAVTHPGFLQVVRDVIRGSRYTPGRISGAAVWTLMEERLVFSLPARGHGGSVTVREPLHRSRFLDCLGPKVPAHTC